MDDCEYEPGLLFDECTQALKQLKQQYEIMQRHTLLYHRASEAQACYETLKKALAYLQRSNTHAISDCSMRTMNCSYTDIEDFIEGKTTGAANKARAEESSLLNRLIAVTHSIRIHILDEMTGGQILQLMSLKALDEIKEVRELCKHEKSECEAKQNLLSQNYQDNCTKTKASLRVQLVEMEYAMNKRLNKFEPTTCQSVFSTVDAKLDKEWNSHLSLLPQLRHEEGIQLVNAGRWEDKMKALESIMDPSIPNNKTPNDTNNTKLGEQICEITDQIQQQDLLNTNVEDMPGQGNIGTKRLSISTISRTPCPKSHQHALDHTAADRLAQKTTITESTSIVITRAPLSEIHNDKTRDPSPASTAPLSNFVATPNSNKEDSFTFISKRELEYDFNKENTPTVALPPSVKASYTKAFAGIDKYARDLFARSPSQDRHVETTNE